MNIPSRSEFDQNHPVRTAVIKVASRCNLACTYCYIYEMADQSWRRQPQVIDTTTIEAIAKRLAEYAQYRSLSALIVVAHGGEPLLIGPERLAHFFTTISHGLDTVGCETHLGVQTNGTLLSMEAVQKLKSRKVHIGISLDGPPKVNDEHRVDKHGIGTSGAVLDGLSRLREATNSRPLLGGFLSYADISVPPIVQLDYFIELGAAQVDFLFPNFNHDTLPKEYRNGALGRWMIQLFNLWMDRSNQLEVRTFTVIMRLLLGGKFGYESFGAESQKTIAVEPDGTYHASDVLKSAYEGVTSTGMDVWHHEIREVESMPLIAATSSKAVSAANECLACPIFSVCGGGLVAHRYSKAQGFNRVSVYCEDIKLLVRHIMDRLKKELMGRPDVTVSVSSFSAYSHRV
ncbi:radical SAM protein [Actinomadura graeca]|uniref:Radical SAM protein n=2 Tax=Actinomadura graeca TaxID=2750812 RepID=A0ABX8R708_9ACTN|nr:radical SAM protein [Actinomadura graeca]